MDIVFNGGDEVRQPFRIMVGNVIADLTGCTVSARILPYANMILSEGTGLFITNPVPSGDDSHGYIVLNEAATASLPQGRVARVRYIVVNADGVTVSTTDTYLSKVG